VSQALVGRDAALQQVRRALAGGSLFVRGEAGMGKTALLRAAVAESDAHLGWGTCVERGAPGYWPWTQALSGLVRAVGLEHAQQAAGHDRGLLAALVPALGDARAADPTDRERLLQLDATVSWLMALASERPVIVVLDDLQWADASSLALLEQLVTRPRHGQLSLVGAYRAGEAPVELDRAAALGEHLVLGGLDRAATAELVRRVLGPAATDALVDRVHARAAGHPLFTRELALAQSEGGALPTAVRQAVAYRVGALSPDTQDVLTTAALVGNTVPPELLAEVHGDRQVVDIALDDALRAGLVQGGDEWRFTHDVFREAIVDDVSTAERTARHAAIAEALEARADRGAAVSAAQVARHYRAGLPASSLVRAGHWALRAVRVDLQALALEEASSHARRLRAAVADAGLVLPEDLLTDLLLAEADVLSRTGRTPDSRGLIRAARDVAARVGDGPRLARSALAAAALGSRFATRRDEVVAELEGALAALEGHPALRAQLIAVLARELQHSVPEQRARSGPLTEQALELARGTDDLEVLRACLLARHDVLWTPGAAEQRLSVADELADLARRRGDDTWLAEALLLQANALLEAGHSRFGIALSQCLELLERLDLPAHRYTVLTRRACLALIRGELAEAEALIEEAAAQGERLREPDTANVRMSQRLELVCARNDPAELRSFADEAVAHWTGVPVHAHGVAAGFSARAGDLEAARHHLAVVQELGSWRTDRSYLWSVYVRELAVAAIALKDQETCADLLEDVRPFVGTCGVNGAAVAFAGCHSRTAGLLLAALGETDESERLLDEAARVEVRLGIRSARTSNAFRRRGSVWNLRYGGRSATVPHSKGILDLAALLAHPRQDVHVLDLIQASVVSSDTGPALDRSAVAGYRARLESLSEARVEASGDAARLAAIDAEHEALAAELRKGSALPGRPRALGSSTSERARKAVAARIRDAIRRIEEVLPELGTHLDRSLATGVRCRYTGDEIWQVET
jgi:hypothetical protein